MSQRRRRAAEKTRREVLDGARAVFAQKGFHGTSLRDLESQSGVSKGLILHHFGSKDRLYAAVRQELAAQYVSSLQASLPAGGSLREMAEAAVRASFDETARDDHYLRVSMWASLENLDSVSRIERDLTTTLISMMREGQKSGVVRDDVNPAILPFVVKGAIEYWLRSSTLVSQLAETVGTERAELDRDLIDGIVKLLFVEGGET